MKIDAAQRLEDNDTAYSNSGAIRPARNFSAASLQRGAKLSAPLTAPELE